MSTLKLGNLSPEEFAERVGTQFTDDELVRLYGRWSQQAQLTGPEDFHIFDSPSISITVGSRNCEAIEIFEAANTRAPFNREVPVYPDTRHRVDAIPREQVEALRDEFRARARDQDEANAESTAALPLGALVWAEAAEAVHALLNGGEGA